MRGYQLRFAKANHDAESKAIWGPISTEKVRKRVKLREDDAPLKGKK